MGERIYTLLHVGRLENFTTDTHSKAFAQLESGAWVGKSVPFGGTRSTPVPLTHFGICGPVLNQQNQAKITTTSVLCFFLKGEIKTN